MGLLQRLRDAFRGEEPQNATEVMFSPEFVAAILGNGGALNVQTALQVSTVLRCAAIISDDICSVPWKLYRNVGDEKVEARDHPLWDVINANPNEWQTSFDFRKTIGLHLALEGNAYVFVNRVGKRIVELIPLEPNMVQVTRWPDWTLTYRVTFPDGRNEIVPQSAMWHLKNHSWNSYKGLNPLIYAKTAIELARQLEKTQGEVHLNTARPSGVLSVNRELDTAQFKEFRKLIDAQVASRLNKGLPMVVDKSTTWAAVQGGNSQDNQTIETRGFQVEDICRDMGVLPIMVGYTGDKGSTYASAEQMFISHYTRCTRVWHRNVEQGADKWLLSKKDRADGYYTGFVDQELLRGDAKARGEFYRLLWSIGAITGNEIRKFEEMNRMDGLDRPWGPLNSAPIGTDGMPMVADNQAMAATAALKAMFAALDPAEIPSTEQLAKLVTAAFNDAGPTAQQRFLSHLRSAEAAPSD